MTSSVSSADETSTSLRSRLSRVLRWGMEGVILLMVALAPWALGSVDPVFEFALDAGIALLLVLWAAKVAVDGQFVWVRCPVTLCLAGLFLWGALQLVPLPDAILSTVA